MHWSIVTDSREMQGGTGLPSHWLSANWNHVKGPLLYIMQKELYLVEQCFVICREKGMPSNNSSQSWLSSSYFLMQSSIVLLWHSTNPLPMANTFIRQHLWKYVFHSTINSYFSSVLKSRIFYLWNKWNTTYLCLVLVVLGSQRSQGSGLPCCTLLLSHQQSHPQPQCTA